MPPALFSVSRMTGQTPNNQNITRVARPTSQVVHLTVHPEFDYWKPEWRKLRDVIAGEREIKRQGKAYLPAMKGADNDDYAIYIDRAAFYNMTAQTLNGMLGQVFRRDPIIRNLPKGFKDQISVRFAKDGTGFAGFAKATMGEQIGMGRFGVLVDAPDQMVRGKAQSYVVGYPTENILDWTIESVDGFYQPTRVLLREFVREGSETVEPKELTVAEARKLRKEGRLGMPRHTQRAGDGYTYQTRFRELVLQFREDGERVYRQYLYMDDPTGAPYKMVEPVIAGKPLGFIPFEFFGASSNSGDVEKPPLLDIANLNLSHYRTYAELEYGRLFTALPVYYAPGTDAEGASEYHIGPNMVWEVPQGSQPGILEYTGQGLKALESALADKERQIAAIGGRLMPGASKSVSESNNQTQLREANEQSLLLNVIQACERGLARVVRWWLLFRDVQLGQTETLRVEINQDFLSTPIGAREIRAIQMLYHDGFIPVDVLYEYFRKAELIPSSMEPEEFKAMLNDPNSFINNPDAQARQRGFSDRAQELEQARVAREADMQQQELDLHAREVELDEDKFELSEQVGATSVSATRKLGDPEQAAPSKAEQGAIDVQKAAQKSQAAAAKAAAAKPAPAPAAAPTTPQTK